MDATTPANPDDEFDLDVRFEESGLDIAEGDTDDCTEKDCTDDECQHTRDACD